MREQALDEMDLDDLWNLHKKIVEILDRRLENEARKLQNQLDELHRRLESSQAEIPQRRPYPKVLPRYRNPNDPSETWSGRGKTPRWLAELIAAGRQLDEFRIR